MRSIDLKRLEIDFEQLELFVNFVAKRLKPNTTILLNGEIGTGKTTFVKHLFKHLGYLGVVSSPTFTLIKQYQTDTLHLIHVDAYRNVNNGYISLDDYVESPYILCAEWSEYIQSELPEEYIQIDIEYTDFSEKRFYTLKIVDGRYKESDFEW